MEENKEFDIYKYIGVHTDSATITELVSKYKDLRQELDKLKDENCKLTYHKEMQDLTIEKLYNQLNNPQTTFTSNGYLQTDLPNAKLEYTFTCSSCNKQQELDKYKAKEVELREYCNEVIHSKSFTKLPSGKLSDVGYCIDCAEDILDILDRKDK